VGSKEKSGVAKDNDSASSSSKFGAGIWGGSGDDVDAIIIGGLIGKGGVGDDMDAIVVGRLVGKGEMGAIIVGGLVGKGGVGDEVDGGRLDGNGGGGLTAYLENGTGLE